MPAPLMPGRSWQEGMGLVGELVQEVREGGLDLIMDSREVLIDAKRNIGEVSRDDVTSGLTNVAKTAGSALHAGHCSIQRATSVPTQTAAPLALRKTSPLLTCRQN